MNKPARTDVPIHTLLADRWSPRAFSDRSVTEEQLHSLLEAARWAASSFNEQPWRFIVASKQQPEAYQRLLACINAWNQKWAAAAPVLMLTLASRDFAKTGKPNRHAWHDVGAATAQLSLQATALGLAVHPMAGILPEVARDSLQIPDGFDVVAALAIGWPGEPEVLPEDLRDKERAARSRESVGDLVFMGTFGRSWTP